MYLCFHKCQYRYITHHLTHAAWGWAGQNMMSKRNGTNLSHTKVHLAASRHSGEGRNPGGEAIDGAAEHQISQHITDVYFFTQAFIFRQLAEYFPLAERNGFMFSCDESPDILTAQKIQGVAGGPKVAKE